MWTFLYISVRTGLFYVAISSGSLQPLDMFSMMQNFGMQQGSSGQSLEWFHLLSKYWRGSKNDHIYFKLAFWPVLNVTGLLGWLVQPLSMVTTVMETVSPQFRPVREQLVPLEVQLRTEGEVVTTYRSAFKAAFQVTEPTLPAHCRDARTFVGAQGPARELSLKNCQERLCNYSIIQLYNSNLF